MQMVKGLAIISESLLKIFQRKSYPLRKVSAGKMDQVPLPPIHEPNRHHFSLYLHLGIPEASSTG